MKKHWFMVAVISLMWGPASAMAQQLPADTLFFPNPSGSLATFSGSSSTGSIDFNQPFFQPIGLQYGGNNRTCSTCHIPAQDWSVTPSGAQAVFNATNGLDPLFLPVDGANAPNADRSTLEARRRASSLLLNKGLIRVAIPVRSTAEFTLVAVRVPQDGSFPSDFAQRAINAQSVSVYRRPPSVANLGFISDIMWDGRFTNNNLTLLQQLTNQDLAAARGHLQANIPPFSRLTAAQQQEFNSILAFETNLFAAQIQDNRAGRLDSDNALGGPFPLFSPPPAFFQGGVFNLFTPWGTIANAAKQSVQRGEAIFNSRTFNTGAALVGTATCTTCHSERGVGNNVAQRRFNLDLARPNVTIAGVAVNAPLPAYTFRNKANGQTLTTTDPGRMLISGRFGGADASAFRPPLLRGLAGRAPYFHGGQGLSLPLVVRFYNNRFAIGLTAAQQQDLVNFLASL